MKLYLCYRCFNYAEPFRQWNSNAKMWYMGCSRCGSGVFYN